MAGAANDDLFLVMVRYAPLVFVVAGVLVVLWLSQQRLPHELQPDVLAALSETEALPSWTIRERPPLVHQEVDLGVLEAVLQHLCRSGLAVRWYELVDVPGPDSTIQRKRLPVYRRVTRSS